MNKLQSLVLLYREREFYSSKELENSLIYDDIDFRNYLIRKLKQR